MVIDTSFRVCKDTLVFYVRVSLHVAGEIPTCGINWNFTLGK